MTSKLHISVFIGIAVLLWAIDLWWLGIPISRAYLEPYSVVVAALFLLSIGFIKYAWSCKILQGWFVDRPDIRGFWHVELNSTYIDPVTKQKIPTIKAYVAIKETLTTLSFKLMTEKADSLLLAHTFIKRIDGSFQMAGIYLNEPKFEQRMKDSKIHYGSVLLQINSFNPSSIEGHYWTDRETSGSMLLTQRTNKIYDSYEEAQRAFAESGKK